MDLLSSARRRPVVATLWVLLALVALAQIGRLTAFMIDDSNTWGSAFPDPKATRHQCLAAYVHAADLSRRGEKNVYAARHYPAFKFHPGQTEPDQGGESPVRGLGPYLLDAYEYPPPFLVLPRAALAVTNDFDVIRTVWFFIQLLAFAGVVVLCASWIGGREGLVAGLLLPALLASLPTMLGLQFGQFHSTAIVLSVGAMLAFEAKRPALGGAALACALVAKVFPGILLVPLALQKRWREVAWTVAFSVAITLLSLAVLGTAPFRAFFAYQLPRIASGEAFSFFERNLFFISRNASIYGIVIKLRELGVPGMSHGLARAVSWVYTAVLVWFAWLASRPRDRLRTAQAWVALLFLASLRSPLAPTAYGVVPALWLLTLLCAEIRGRRPVLVASVVASWIFVMGLPPMKGTTELLLGMVGQSIAIGVAVWTLLRPTHVRAEAIGAPVGVAA
jgi:hypothetical protein